MEISMIFIEKIHIEASAETIFSLYKDVNNWSVWDPEIKKSSIDGEFKSGTTGYLKPLSGPKNKFVLTNVEQDKLFTVRIKLPLCTMDFEHELIPQSSGTEVLHRIIFKGLLGSVFGKLIGNKLKKEQSRTMLALKKKAEN